VSRLPVALDAAGRPAWSRFVVVLPARPPAEQQVTGDRAGADREVGGQVAVVARWRLGRCRPGRLPLGAELRGVELVAPRRSELAPAPSSVGEARAGALA
jgi:hypothetical protein